MTRHIRLTAPFIVFLALAVAGAIPLIQTHPLFTLFAIIGGFGVGAMGMAILLAPRSSRIRRPASRPSRSSNRPRKSTGTRTPRSGTGAGAGAAGSKKKPRGRNRSNGAPKIAGTVKWFSDKKGFGFITPENGEEDCFVHRSAVKGAGSLNEGNRVEFQIVSDDKGRRAAANVVSL